VTSFSAPRERRTIVNIYTVYAETVLDPLDKIEQTTICKTHLQGKFWIAVMLPINSVGKYANYVPHLQTVKKRHMRRVCDRTFNVGAFITWALFARMDGWETASAAGTVWSCYV